MLALIRSELFKMSRRPRSYIAFAAFLLINVLLLIGVKHEGANMSIGNGLQTVGSPLNGEFMAWLAIGSPVAGATLVMFLPFFVCMIFGEIFAGEHVDGTLRTLLTRPISRLSLFGAKLVSSWLYAFGVTLFIGVTAYVLGLIFFGRGGLLATASFHEMKVAWYPEWQGLARLGLAYLLTGFAMATIGMLAMFISAWLNNPLGAIGGAFFLLLAVIIVGQIPYFAEIKDYLFATHLDVGQQAFKDPIPWSEIRSSLGCLSAYGAAFLAASAAVFARKDVLS